MSVSRTASEILKGLWMIAPHMLNSYLKASVQIVEGQTTLANNRDHIQGVLIREVIDPNGNVININQEDIPADSVGVVRCIGPMYKYGSWFNWGTDELLEFARYFDDHPNIIGQVWQDDSGGGTVSSVGPYLDFLKTKKKPVVSCLDLCASASYYKNCGTDFVMAENNISSMFGSIGVMIQFYDFAKMLTEMGIKEHIVYADQSEHKNQDFDEALKGKYKLMKTEMLNPVAIRFQDYVKMARPKINLEVEGIISGKMFYAEEALEQGMIDGIGSLGEAIERVKFLASARSFITRN